MIIPVFIPHWGCPQQCIYCNQRTISGEHLIGIEAAREQIETYLRYTEHSRDGQRQLSFYGGSFTALPMATQRELLALGESYLRQGLIASMRLSTRPDALSPEIVRQLKAYHVTTVELGVQSMDDAVLTQARRGHDSKCVAPAVELLREFGMEVILQLMLGLPGQDAASALDTCQKIIALKPDGVRIYPVLVIYRTPLAKLYAAGKYTPLSLEAAVAQCYELKQAFTVAHIPVIRMGLQPDKELCAPGNILAGPFHPAFGELVLSYGYKMRISDYIAQLPSVARGIKIYHTKQETSQIVGQGRKNMLFWQELRQIEITMVKGTEFSLEWY